jgi:hypothetical protein
LASRINVGAVEGVAADDVYIFWEIFLESFNLWSFARSLASDNGILFGGCTIISNCSSMEAASRHTWTIFSDDLANRCCFNVVDNVVACSGDEMSIGKDLDLLLWTSQHSGAGNAMYKGVLLYLQTLHTDPHISLLCRRR